jgi:aminopeptidase N
MTSAHRLHARCGCAAAHMALAARPFPFPGTTRKYERNRPFTIKHIALDLALDFPGRSLSGSATLDVERVDAAAVELRLDAVSFDLQRVTIDTGKGMAPASHVYDGDVITITIPDDAPAARIRIEYATSPRRGLYFIAPDDHVQDRPRQVWTQCQDEDARHWFPCHDKPHVKQTTELRVRIPSGWYALSNGSLLAHETLDDGEIFHWKIARPHASYLVTLVAGEFAHLDGGQVGDVPISYLVPRGREADGERTFRETPGMLRHFEQLTGVTFPWEKYAQVVVSDFTFGGMENTTATTMYEYILLDERAAIDITSTDLVAHELAHQWFGDFVTCRDWSHGWLNEGFATFMEHVDRERRLGEDEYDYGIKQDQDAYLAEASARYQRPIVCQDYELPIDLFDRHLYEKGGLVLHMLRRELGEPVFWKGVGEYLRRHAFGVVETRDLQRALEHVSGRSLDRFFEQWVFKAGHPQLDVKVEYAQGSLLIEVKQTQKVTAEVPQFALELEVDIYPERGEPRREVLHIERPSETYAVVEHERPGFIVIDPRHLIIGEVTIEVPTDMLRHQLAEAPTARGRSMAAHALGRRDDPASHAALTAVLNDEGAFWGLRAEAAHALATIRSQGALAALVAAVNTPHSKVRRAVAWALGRFQKTDAAAALKPLALRDASYAVEAEAARALGHTRQPIAFDTLVEVLDRPSWADLIRAGAIDGLAALRDDRALPHLVARARYGVPMRARRAAIRALPKLSADRRTREMLEDLLEDPDPHLRVDVAVAVGDLGDTKSRGALGRALERELDGRVRRRIREVVRDLGGSPRAEQQRLTDELERIKSDHADLRSRLAKIEARVAPPTAEGSEKPAAPVRASKPGKPGKPAGTGAPGEPRRSPARASAGRSGASAVGSTKQKGRGAGKAATRGPSKGKGNGKAKGRGK